MSYEYRGPEIISELLINIKTKGGGKIKQKQRVDVKCSVCFNIKNVVYQGHVENRLKHPDREYLCNICFNRRRFIEYNKNSKNKTLEERLGVEKAQKTKEKISKASIERRCINSISHMWGMTWDEKFGKDKADAMRKFSSENCNLKPKFGKDNPQFGKPAHKLSGKGTKGYYLDIYFRSLLEASFIHYLISNNISFENGECKKYAIPYIFEGRERNYFSDFIVGDTIYEIKPKSLWKTWQNCAKFDAAREWCMKNNKKYIIMSEYDFHQLTQVEIDTFISEGKIKLI